MLHHFLIFQLFIFCHMLFYRLDNRISIKSAAIVIDKLSLRIHQVKNNCVINNVVIVLISLSFTKVDTELFSYLSYFIFCFSSETNYSWNFEIFQIFFDNFWSVSLRVQSDKYWLQSRQLFLSVNSADDFIHFLHFFWAYIWTMRKPEVDKHPITFKLPTRPL